jgi:uncharacterized membrane protein (DUF2068 family)
MAETKRDAVIVLIAVFKLVKGAVLIAAGVAVLSLVDGDPAAAIERLVHELHLDPGNRVVRSLVDSVGDLDDGKLRLVGAGSFAYAAVFGFEGVALLMRKAWAEWLTVGVTASFIPLEVWETARHFSLLKVGGIALNVAIVAYLVVHVRRRKGKAASRARPTFAGAHAADSGKA